MTLPPSEAEARERFEVRGSAIFRKNYQVAVVSLGWDAEWIAKALNEKESLATLLPQDRSGDAIELLAKAYDEAGRPSDALAVRNGDHSSADGVYVPALRAIEAALSQLQDRPTSATVLPVVASPPFVLCDDDAEDRSAPSKVLVSRGYALERRALSYATSVPAVSSLLADLGEYARQAAEALANRSAPDGWVLADELRAQGYTVAVHNDYRLNGKPHTFWLWTNSETGRFIKGEGRTDAEALVQCQALAAAPLTPSEESGV